MIAGRERKLRRTFRRLVWLACAAPAGAYACASASSRSSPADSGTDSSATTDAATDAADTAARIPDASAETDAGISDVSLECQRSAPYFIDASNVIIGDANCFYFVDFPCGSSFTGAEVNCYLTASDCLSICTLDGAPPFDCQYWPLYGCAGGNIDVKPGQPTKVGCGVCPGVGRRPAGLARPGRSTGSPGVLATHFAGVAHLEEASVHAFHRLGRELRAHGAPRDLVRAAERSARDEVRHARVTARLARRFGGAPARVRVRACRVRSLGRVAVENAVEGCVREAFGAVVATWQSVHARDPAVRAAMRRIALDETRHAALAFEVARWLEPRLGARARKRVAAATRAAIADLELQIEDPDAALVRDAGLPARASALRLLEGLPCAGGAA